MQVEDDVHYMDADIIVYTSVVYRLFPAYLLRMGNAVLVSHSVSSQRAEIKRGAKKLAPLADKTVF